MLIQKDAARFLSVIFISAMCTTGCDRISSVKDYFTGSEPKNTANMPAGSSISPAPGTAKGDAPMTTNTLARVGSWSITVKEFKERLEALKEVIPEYDTNDLEARRLVLDELVNQQVLVLGAEKSGLAGQKDINAAVDEFRRTLIVREVARQLTENVTVTDEEALQFYNDNKEQLIDAGQWHVREIVVPTKEQAMVILGEILKGADFAATAKLQSKGETAANGGDLGFITEEPFPQMGNALLSLEVGDVSGIFKGPEGYYIVKLEEKKEGEPILFEEIKNDIIQNQTLMKQQDAILNHLNRLKSMIQIDINEQLL